MLWSLSRRRGFTLIELLVVISIIGFLSSVVIASLNSARIKGRDTRRKQDLHNLAIALELYYTNNNAYPVTNASGGSYVNGKCSSSNCTWLTELLTDGQFKTLPVDPINVDKSPWPNGPPTGASQNTIYTYTSDGKHYVLCAWAENTTDSSTLQYVDVVNPWNTAQKLYANNSYSKYNICFAR